MTAYRHVTVLQALVRDGFRCRVSGRYDYESAQTWPAVKAMANEAQAGYTDTECCHIFSEGTLQSANRGENQVSGSILSRGPKIDTLQERSCCYYIRNIGIIRT